MADLEDRVREAGPALTPLGLAAALAELVPLLAPEPVEGLAALDLEGSVREPARAEAGVARREAQRESDLER